MDVELSEAIEAGESDGFTTHDAPGLIRDGEETRSFGRLDSYAKETQRLVSRLQESFLVKTKRNSQIYLESPTETPVGSRRGSKLSDTSRAGSKESVLSRQGSKERGSLLEGAKQRGSLLGSGRSLDLSSDEGKTARRRATFQEARKRYTKYIASSESSVARLVDKLRHATRAVFEATAAVAKEVILINVIEEELQESKRRDELFQQSEDALTSAQSVVEDVIAALTDNVPFSDETSRVHFGKETSKVITLARKIQNFLTKYLTELQREEDYSAEFHGEINNTLKRVRDILDTFRRRVRVEKDIVNCEAIVAQAMSSLHEVVTNARQSPSCVGAPQSVVRIATFHAQFATSVGENSPDNPKQSDKYEGKLDGARGEANHMGEALRDSNAVHWRIAMGATFNENAGHENISGPPDRILIGTDDLQTEMIPRHALVKSETQSLKPHKLPERAPTEDSSQLPDEIVMSPTNARTKFIIDFQTDGVAQQAFIKGETQSGQPDKLLERSRAEEMSRPDRTLIGTEKRTKSKIDHQTDGVPQQALTKGKTESGKLDKLPERRPKESSRRNDPDNLSKRSLIEAEPPPRETTDAGSVTKRASEWADDGPINEDGLQHRYLDEPRDPTDMIAFHQTAKRNLLPPLDGNLSLSALAPNPMDQVEQVEKARNASLMVEDSESVSAGTKKAFQAHSQMQLKGWTRVSTQGTNVRHDDKSEFQDDWPAWPNRQSSYEAIPPSLPWSISMLSPVTRRSVTMGAAFQQEADKTPPSLTPRRRGPLSPRTAEIVDAERRHIAAGGKLVPDVIYASRLPEPPRIPDVLNKSPRERIIQILSNSIPNSRAEGKQQLNVSLPTIGRSAREGRRSNLSRRLKWRRHL